MQNEFQYLLNKIEDLERRLTVVGDEATIAVEHTPSGQIVSSALDQYAPESTEETSLYRVSYDSINDYYTVSITSIPFIADGGFSAPPGGTYDTLSKTFKFAGGSSYAVNLILRRYENTGAAPYDIYWQSTINESAIYNSDATTSENIYGLSSSANVTGIFQSISFDGIGGFEFQYAKSYPIYAVGDSQYYVKPQLTYRNGTLRLYGTISAYAAGDINGIENLSKSGLAGPYTNEKIIVGRVGTGGTYSLDMYDNRASYDFYAVIGAIEVDANDILRWKSLYMTGGTLPPLGYTGNVSTTSGLLRFEAGILKNIT